MKTARYGQLSMTNPIMESQQPVDRARVEIVHPTARHRFESFHGQTICLTDEIVAPGRPALLRRCRDVDRQAQCGSGHLHDTRGSHFALG
jgi:hypothetical protein